MDTQEITPRKAPRQAEPRSIPFGAYIHDYYGIAIKKGMHVVDQDGKKGVVVAATNHVKVKVEGQKGHSFYHPQALSYPALGIEAKAGA